MAVQLINNLLNAVAPRGLPLGAGAIAANLLDASRIGPGSAHQMGRIENALDAMAQADPALEKAVRSEVMSNISPLEQGELLRLNNGGKGKRATVIVEPVEDGPPPPPPPPTNRIEIGHMLLANAATSPDAHRAAPFFRELERPGTSATPKDAALSSIASYNYEGVAVNGVRRNDVDAGGQMKRIPGTQEQLLAHVDIDMGFPNSETAAAMYAGYSALANDTNTHPQIRGDAAQVVHLLDTRTAQWNAELASIQLNITAPAQIAYDARQRSITAFANTGLTRDLASFAVTAFGGAAIGVAAPAAGALAFAEGTPLFYAATGASGGTLNVGLGEITRRITGDASTAGKRVSDFVAGGFVVVGVTPFATKFPIAAGLAGGGGAGFAGSVFEGGLDNANVNLSEATIKGSVGAIAGGAGAGVSKSIGEVSIPGITSGRGNWMSVHQGSVTRVNNGNATSVPTMVMVKGRAGEVVQAMPSSIVDATVQTGYGKLVEPEKATKP